MLFVLQRCCTLMLYFLVLWYPGRDGSEETQITFLKTAYKFPGERRKEGRNLWLHILQTLPWAAIGPPVSWSHRHNCLDIPAWIYFQHLQSSCNSGTARIDAPSCWTWYRNHRAKTLNDGPKQQGYRWPQHGMDGLDFTSQPNFASF